MICCHLRAFFQASDTPVRFDGFISSPSSTINATPPPQQTISVIQPPIFRTPQSQGMGNTSLSSYHSAPTHRLLCDVKELSQTHFPTLLFPSMVSSYNGGYFKINSSERLQRCDEPVSIVQSLFSLTYVTSFSCCDEMRV